MKYLVLYPTTQNIEVPRTPDKSVWGMSLQSPVVHQIYSTHMEVFDNEKEAADCAAKCDGYIVIPANIESKIVEVKG
jgi:hypothetical protein